MCSACRAEKGSCRMVKLTSATRDPAVPHSFAIASASSSSVDSRTEKIPMESRWSEAAAAELPDLEQLLYASRLVGADQSLVLWGGGNTSAKVEESDFRGRRVPVLRVKGSGSDLRTIRPQDFPGVRLEDVLPLLERDEMADEEMVAYLAHTLMEPTSPRP